MAEAGGGQLVIHKSNEGVLDKTWKEIHDAIQSGVSAIIVKKGVADNFSQSFVFGAALTRDGSYVVNAFDPPDASGTYTTDTENGYPTLYTPPKV